MKLLAPLGLLALIGIILLIVIYLVKPNYQKKAVSATYVWKLSLKYRKKQIPTGKIRNILLFVCQILVITACALVLAYPVITNKNDSSDEKAIIIDQSVNMLVSYDGSTRLQRATDKAKKLVEQTFDEDGTITLIVAGETAKVPFSRVKSEKRGEITQYLSDLAAGAEGTCHTSGNVAEAVKAANDVLKENPSASVVLYTGTNYDYDGGVTIENVAVDGEWNAAVLGVNAKHSENVYSFEAEVACYGANKELTVYCTVYGVNGSDAKILRSSRTVKCVSGEKTEVVFKAEDGEEDVTKYSSVKVFIDADDSLGMDNEYELYGGKLEEVKSLYYSAEPNKFWQAALESLRNALRSRWLFADSNEVYPTVTSGASPKADEYTSGYDLYIFEKKMPTVLPKNGLILLVNPENVPSDANFRLGEERIYALAKQLTKSESSAITDGVNDGEISVSRIRKITPSSEYVTLLSCEEYPAVLYKRDKTSAADRHVIVMAFSPNYSDVTMTLSFLRLVYNAFNYALPTTITDENGNKTNVFEVGEKVKLTPRGYNLTVTKDGFEADENTFSGAFTEAGTYTVKQTVFPGTEITERLFVKIASKESDIKRTEENLGETLKKADNKEGNYDLLVYFAAALLVLLVAEWALHAKENY